MQVIHEFVEALDRYFGNVFSIRNLALTPHNFVQVCELDLIFNFHKAYYILDEVLLCGEQQETSKKIVLRVIAAQVSCCMCCDFLLYFALCSMRAHLFEDILLIYKIYLRILCANPRNLAGSNTHSFPLRATL